MGWNPESQQLEELNPEQAKNWTKGPVFRVGEDIELKGVTFIVVDIAPSQIKLKPKRTNEIEEMKTAKAAEESRIR